MKENTKKLGYRLGVLMASTCAICLSTCFMAVVIMLTYKFLSWLWGGIM